MNSIDDFMALVRDELGLLVTTDHADRGFDEVPGWDSVHLLWLLAGLERTTGQRLSMPDVLQASNLAEIYALTIKA